MTTPRDLIEVLRKHRNDMELDATVLHFYDLAKIYSTSWENVEKMLPFILLLGLEISEPIEEIYPGEFQMTVKLM